MRMQFLALLSLTVLVPAARAGEEASRPDPTKLEVRLPTVSPAWRASLVIDNAGTGIWTVESFQVFPQFGCPEVVGLDDKGRCLVMVSYSGKWTPFPAIYDVKWLGGLAHGDLDPRLPGAELYTGGKRGNLYQIVSYKQAALDHRLISYLPGREIHSLVAGELDPRSKGPELLVFTRPGALYRVSPNGPDGTFTTTKLAELPGRVRQARVIPGPGGRIVTVERTGRVSILRITQDGLSWTRVYEAPMGMGRIALRPGTPLVIYSTHDDGRILRHEERGGGWATEVIYHGPQGPRGVAAGRFDADPTVETVAIFGYSRKVELLTRTTGGWKAETIFEDLDKGHWLAAAELDGRNATRELIASGYGARIVLLSRPPGYGRPETATPDAPEPAPAPEAEESD